MGVDFFKKNRAVVIGEECKLLDLIKIYSLINTINP
jgi:hypothetical protein